MSFPCLREQVALVTGSASGIGAAVAKSYAQLGAQVVLLDKDVAGLERVYDEIMAAGYPQPAIYPLDFQQAYPEQYQELASTLQRELGRLDILLNNAGMLGRLTPLEHYPIKTWYETLQVNVNAAFLMTQACLPLLKRAPAGHLIFTVCNENVAKAYWGAYAVSQYSLRGLQQVLAQELSNTSVTTYCIDPGPVDTTMRAQAYPAEQRDRLAKPAEIASRYSQCLRIS